MFMAIGIGFANDEYDNDFESYYQAELDDAPIGAGGFVKDICYERALERYNADHQPEEKEQGFI